MKNLFLIYLFCILVSKMYTIIINYVCYVKKMLINKKIFLFWTFKKIIIMYL